MSHLKITSKIPSFLIPILVLMIVFYLIDTKF